MSIKYLQSVANSFILHPLHLKGMADGEKITFDGEGDQDTGLEAGDVIIILDEKSHNVFQRRGNDLIMKMKLELVESLCGFEKPVHTLDSRELLVQTVPGERSLLNIFDD